MSGNAFQGKGELGYLSRWASLTHCHSTASSRLSNPSGREFRSLCMKGKASMAVPIEFRIWLCQSSSSGSDHRDRPSTTSRTATPATLYFASRRRGQVLTITDPPMLCPTNCFDSVKRHQDIRSDAQVRMGLQQAMGTRLSEG